MGPIHKLKLRVKLVTGRPDLGWSGIAIGLLKEGQTPKDLLALRASKNPQVVDVGWTDYREAEQGNKATERSETVLDILYQCRNLHLYGPTTNWVGLEPNPSEERLCFLIKPGYRHLAVEVDGVEFLNVDL